MRWIKEKIKDERLKIKDYTIVYPSKIGIGEIL